MNAKTEMGKIIDQARDALPDECRKAFEHIRSCPICAAFMIEIGRKAETLGYNFEIIKPK